jgi:hypothetical protein
MAGSLLSISVPVEANVALLKDAIARDLPTARRHWLFQILWRERYYGRAQLIERVERELGRDCFGKHAWEDTFYRDMRAVKKAFRAAGYRLKYKRSGKKPGYFLEDQPALHERMLRRIQGALAELDDQQCRIYGEIPPAQKFFQAVSMIESGRRVVALQKTSPLE